MYINSIEWFRLETEHVVLKFVEILLSKQQWDSINARLNGHTLGVQNPYCSFVFELERVKQGQ